MHVILGVFVAFPAFVFFVTSLALRLDPIRSAACRALLGMVALACFALQIISPPNMRLQVRMANRAGPLALPPMRSTTSRRPYPAADGGVLLMPSVSHLKQRSRLRRRP